MPPVPAFYLKPRSIDELIHHTVARMLDLFDLDVALARWGESSQTKNFEQQPLEAVR